MNIQRPTPDTDAAFRDGYTFCREDMRPAVEFCANLERERDEAREELEATRIKIEFLASKGITVGILKSSDCPQGQLAYDIKPDSELCDLKHLDRVIEAEAKLEAMREAIKEAHEALRIIHDVVNEHVGNPVVIVPLGYANAALAKLQPFLKP